MTRPRLRFQNHILLLVIITAIPAWLIATILLWNWEAAPLLRWTLFGLITLFISGGALVVRGHVVYPLQSLSNLLEALREEDYSLRGRNIDPEDALGEVMVEVNSLSRMLYDQRLGALEAGVLLEKVISEIEIAVFAFDAERTLRLTNRAGAALLGGSINDLIDRKAADLGLEQMLDVPSGSISSHVFPAGSGRWEIRRRSFREGGRPHELLVISDLSHALREEERQAWRRMVRVIGHELNSSLTPIKSMTGTIRKLIDKEPLPDDWRDDAHAGLSIMHDRAESLGRFMGAYARLARLPSPVRRDVDFPALVRRVASLHGKNVAVDAGPDINIRVDADQIEQVLINLIKNAVEATGEGGRITVSWHAANGSLQANVEDDGPGLAGTDNLWVPFYTTKPGGTGIGLVLCREIVENHGGNMSLENRKAANGCIARISLPL